MKKRKFKRPLRFEVFFLRLVPVVPNRLSSIPHCRFDERGKNRMWFQDR